MFLRIITVFITAILSFHCDAVVIDGLEIDNTGKTEISHPKLRALSEWLQPNTVDQNYVARVTRKCAPTLCPGRDCVNIPAQDDPSCLLCACPIGSPARGCDPMPSAVWYDLMTNGCPVNGSALERRQAVQVVRWYRRVNDARSIDKCQSYTFPYCAQLDATVWHAPHTQAACEYYCYRDGELPPRSDTRETLAERVADERDGKELALFAD